MAIAGSSDETTAEPEGKLCAMAMCSIFGLGTLLSWNIISTLGDYLYELFPDYHPERVLIVAYLPLSVVLLAIFVCNESKAADTRKRHTVGYVLFFATNFGFLALDLATSGNGGMGKYIGVCFLVVVSSVGEAFVKGGFVGDMALMCPEFVQSFLVGLSASGALTSIIRLITKAAFGNVENGLRKGALVYLAISTCFEFICIILYAFVFPNLPIVIYYRAKAAREDLNTADSDFMTMEAHDDAEILSKKELFFQNFNFVLDLFLIYVVTLSIFPGFLYENTGSHQLGTWYPLILVTTYNVSDLISRYIPLIECLKLESRKGLMMLVLSRFLFIPAFYFTARFGDEGWLIALVSLLGFTTGYPTICIMTLAPRAYKGQERNALGNVLVLTIQCAVALGVALDWLWMIGNGRLL